ncbi:MAG: hypothetical protein J0M19_06465 [Sphingomonadales bacterium]|nr:hypothetical protein [Sphingomonadales bacterium]
MNRFHIIAVGLVALAASARAKPVGEERWYATSNTAVAITGDIRLSPTRLVAAGQTIQLQVSADLPTYESLTGTYPARILKVIRPRRVKMLRNNEFGCGDGARWLVVFRKGSSDSLGIEVFESRNMPRSSHDPGLCGSYGYYR